MVRLEAVAKGLYYPTPPGVVAACATLLRATAPPPRQVYRLLDPCAGEGLALAALAAAIPGARTYGIELNEERGAAARGRLDEVLVIDAYRAMLGNGRFSLLLLNPPYDHGGEAGGRLEHSFLTAFSRTLAPGGLLLFIVPQVILARSARYLTAHFHSIRVWRFPDPDFAAFRQVVVAATRRERALPTLGSGGVAGASAEGWANPATLAALADGALPILPGGAPGETPATPVAGGQPVDDDARGALASGWALPALAAEPPPAFRPAVFEAGVARRAVAGLRGGWAAVGDDLWPPPPPPPVAPLMPLRRGHVAGLLQAGALDGALLTGAGGRTVVVKGRSVKLTDRIETEEATIERERIATSIVAMDAVTGEFIRVGEGAVRREEGAS